MSQMRQIASIFEPQPVIEGAGVHLKRSIATRECDHIDPFLLFDHFKSDHPEDYLKGFPLHPHRGIETVTYMLEGTVDHKDTLGNAGTIGPGDVQWMTSGGGIMHEEMPKPKDGKMDGFQLWVNLPAKLKMSRPNYQEVLVDSIPIVERDDGTIVRVIAGEVDGVKGAVAAIAADPVYIDVTVPTDAVFHHPVTPGHNAIAYIFEGKGMIGETQVEATRMVVFGDGDFVEIKGTGSAVRVLLMSGKPLNEPIARYGPFVMNTQEEIRQALDDLHNGTFVMR